MIHRNYIYFFLFALVLLSCGTTKKVEEKQELSKADHPYIESFHKGVRLEIRGDVDGAIEAFNKCLSMRTNDDAVYYSLSKLYLQKGNREASAENILQARELDPKNIWYTEEIAYMYYERKMFEEAVPEFEKLVEHAPKNLEWLYSYGDCLLRSGETDEAIEVLNKAEDIMGPSPKFALEKFKLLLSVKREKQALEELQNARKQFPDSPQILATLVDYHFKNGDSDKAIDLLKELVKKDPENGRAHLALGDIYHRQKEEEKAYEEFHKAFKCQDLDIDTKMQVLIALQESSYSVSDEAVELMELLLIQHPKEAKAHSIRGDYMYAKGDEKESLKSYRKALEYDKDQYPIWKQVLIMEYQNQSFDTLYQDGKECLNYFAAMPTVYLLFGVGAVQTQHYDEAIDALSTGKALTVEDVSTKAEFNGQLGEAYFGKKEYAEAKKHYEQAIELDPNSNLLKNNYAYQLASAKMELEKALSLVNQALSNSPNSISYKDTKAFVLFQQKKYSDALPLIEEAVAGNTTDATIREHYGDILIQLGKTNEAIEQWEKAQELGSKNNVLEQKMKDKKYYEPEN